MSNMFVKTAVKTLFALTSKEKASVQIQKSCNCYLALAELTDAKSGSLGVHVPRIIGIDEDMRDWSFFMILEHNTIVNRSITSIIGDLIHGREPEGAGAIDMKNDVMPSEHPGEEQLVSFSNSVEEHIKAISNLHNLCDSTTKIHPVFGAFTAHHWHCMFVFHLFLHFKQAKYVVHKVTEKGS